MKQVLGGFGFDSCSHLKRKVLTSKLFPVHLKENHLISFFKVGAYSCPTANFGPLSKGQSHPILITSIYVSTQGHREPHNTVGSRNSTN